MVIQSDIWSWQKKWEAFRANLFRTQKPWKKDTKLCFSLFQCSLCKDMDWRCWEVNLSEDLNAKTLAKKCFRDHQGGPQYCAYWMWKGLRGQWILNKMVQQGALGKQQDFLNHKLLAGTQEKALKKHLEPRSWLTCMCFAISHNHIPFVGAGEKTPSPKISRQYITFINKIQ